MRVDIFALMAPVTIIDVSIWSLVMPPLDSFALKTGLACLFKFLSWLEAEISQNTYFMAAILKIQNGGLNGVGANANINFWILYALMIRKMYRFANLQKFWTKIHSEPDYYTLTWLLHNIAVAIFSSRHQTLESLTDPHSFFI